MHHDVVKNVNILSSFYYALYNFPIDYCIEMSSYYLKIQMVAFVFKFLKVQMVLLSV